MVWREVYGELSRDQPGLLGKLLARSEAHVVRLSALYALISGSHTVKVEHLQSALALWDYSEASVRSIFGQRTGREGADRIVADPQPDEVEENLYIFKYLDYIFYGHH